MEYLRKVVRTNKEPDEKEVLWVDTAHPDYPVMKYYENGNWKLIRQREDGVAYIMPYGGIPYSDLSQEVKMAIASGGAQANWNQTNSASPDFIWNKPYIPTALADLTEDSNHKFVSAAEKTSWSNKAEVSDIPDVSNFITASVDNLVNYYLKSETYTKAEVQALIGAIQQFHYEIYASTAAVTNPQGNVLYLIGPTGSGEDKYEEYVYDVTKQNPWVKIGDTSIDLSNYVTTSDLDTALSAYTTSADLSNLLDAKQDVINDLDDIRDGVEEAVRYTAQTLTSAQQTQARDNIGASRPELLVAEYNVTPFATVITACLAGKNVIVKKNENYKYVVYSLTMWDGDAQIGGTVKFSRINYSSTTSGTIDTISVDNVDGWKILESIPYRESFFIAQYGVTHWSEVLAAYKDGKVLLCRLTTLAQLMVFNPGFEGDDESEPYEGSAAFIYYDPIEKKLIQLVIDGSTDEWQMNRLRYVSDFDGRYASLSGKPTIPDVTGKADKVSNATNGHLAALDSNGNLADSGKSASDFATAAQGAKADTAYQKPSNGIPASDIAPGVIPAGVTVDQTYDPTSQNAQSGVAMAGALSGKQDTIADLSNIRAGAAAGATALQSETDPTVPAWAKAQSKPTYNYSEIQNTPDLSQFITKSVNDLTNYYLKSETYTKVEVQSLISAIQQFTYEVVSTLPTATADTMHKIYLVPSADPQQQNVKDEYITIESSGSYSWEQIGSTAVDLSGYVTTTALNTALSAYTTTANLTTLLAEKQDVISDLATIRSGAAAGATAYQKPQTGIPASDLAAGVIPTVPTDVVKHSQQSLTDEQKTQARTNIGAGTYSKPSGGIPAADIANGVIPDISGKADKVSGATSGHLAALDGNGNLTDSGKSASDLTVEANPTVPSGTTPGTMETIKIGSQYYELGGGTIDAEDYSGVAPVIVNPSNYYTKSETEALVETPVASTQPSGGFMPNVIYDLGEITGSVTFALATPTDNTIANTYVWTFETGSTAPTVAWPSNLTWLGGNAPTINTGKHYEITVRKGYANCLEF